MDAYADTRNIEGKSSVNVSNGESAQIIKRAEWNFAPASQFHDFSDRWRDLNERGPKSPVLEPDLIQAALDSFKDGSEQIAVLEHAQRPIAMAVIRKKNFLVWETFQPSQCPIGAWLVAPEFSSVAVGNALLKALRGFPLLFGVTQLDPEMFARPGPEAAVSTIDYIQTARITIRGTFDEYWAARGKNLRQNMKRQRNMLQRENVETSLEVVTDREKIPAAVEEYGRLETAGWKASSGTAVSMNNSQGKFYIQLLNSFAARGAARIYKYWYGDHLAAIDLCICHNDVLVILKTTYDEGIKNSSPAMLMRQDSFKKIFDGKQFARIEFYGKVMEWHTRWSDEVRTLYHLNCFRWGMLAKVIG